MTARTYSIIVHEIATDGLPDMDNENMTGRVAIVFDGCIVSGWPLPESEFPELYTSQAIERHFGGLAGGAQMSDEQAKELLKQTLWEANSDVGTHRKLSGVQFWIEFPEPISEMCREQLLFAPKARSAAVT